MRNKKRLPSTVPIIALLLLLMLVFLSAEASGQGNVNRAEAELQRTDRIIEEAHSMLQETTNIKAQELVEQAGAVQEYAWESYRDRQYNQAMKLTANARSLVSKAIGLMNRRQENSSFVDKEIERTDALLDRIQGEFTGAEQGAALTMLEQALRLQDRAKEFYSEQQLKQALNLTLRARQFLEKMTEGIGNRNRQQFLAQRASEAVERLLDEWRETIRNSSDDAAVILFEKAERDYERSRELMSQEHWGQANALMANIAATINKARRLVAGGTGADDAQRALTTAGDRLSRLQEAATELGTDDADDLLDEAQEKLEKARKYYDEGEYDRVLIVIRVVVELEQQAARILGIW